MANYIEEFNDALRDAQGSVDPLIDLAESFAHVGNDKVAHDLFVVAAELRRSHKAMANAVSRGLMEQVRAADTHIAEVFIGILKAASGRNVDG